MSSPLVAEIDGDNMKSFIESDDLVFVAQLAAGSGDDETKFEERLLEMTERHQDRFTVGIAAGIAEQNLLQCYNNIDAASFQTAELDTFASIEAFVKKCSAPLIPELTRRNEMEYMSVSLLQTTPTRCLLKLTRTVWQIARLLFLPVCHRQGRVDGHHPSAGAQVCPVSDVRHRRLGGIPRDGDRPRHRRGSGGSGTQREQPSHGPDIPHGGSGFGPGSSPGSGSFHHRSFPGAC